MEKLQLNTLDFSFPFEPYDIQKQFMKALFSSLEDGKLGIFESPTGTGKSLSLICGTLTWLINYMECHKAKLEDQLKINEQSMKESSESFDWFSSASKRHEERAENLKITQELQMLKKQEERIAALKERKKVVKYAGVKKIDNEFDELFKDIEEVKEQVRKELNTVKDNEFTAEENELILDDYNSDDEISDNKPQDNDEDNGCLKIYFCSRTHSQLSQFVREIQRTKFAEHIRVTSLASRQNLCVNQEVQSLSNVSLINDRCMDLQKGKKGKATEVNEDGKVTKKKKTSSGCPYYKQNSINHISDQILLEVQDIEQIVALGKRNKGCPYYASRYAIRDAQIVVLPYNTLLHKSTREAYNIKLKDNIVIVDEAHNLLETISNIHSVTMNQTQLTGCHNQLSQYLQRYEKRLTAQNLLYIKQILFFVNALNKLLLKAQNSLNKTTDQSSNTKGQMLTISQFLSQTFTDNLNLFKLVQYIEKSKIALKLRGFSQLYQGIVQIQKNNPDTEIKSASSFLSKLSNQKSKENLKPSNIIPKTDPPDDTKKEEITMGCPLLLVADLMRALLSSNVDGRIILTIDTMPSKSILKYLLLNPSSQFHDIVKECRSVIVAGGTMRPMSEFRDQLFISANADPSRIYEFSCGHVVPGEQMLPLVLPSGPSNTTLDFTYQKRNDPKILDELGRVLTNICNIVPGGIVVFLPSYDYEKKIYEYFQNNGTLTKIRLKKTIFREPKKSSDLDKVLNEYAKIIKTNIKNTSGLTGSLVFSVVGGKLSEGINFSDDLGRCIVMVGLPYPNSFSPELKEKMEYLNKNVPNDANGRTAGSVYYENLCFKAVNQSIGRAIRHRNDYASIILADHRYNRPSSIKALPEWISQYIQTCNSFGQAFGLLRKFFVNKRSQ